MSDTGRRVNATKLSEVENRVVFELNDNRASAILYADAMTTVFDDLVANFADFKVADKYMDFFKSKVDELDGLKQRIKEDFESSYNLSFKKSKFYPLDKKGISELATEN